MSNIKTFTQWASSYNENDAIATPSSQMVTDVDTIINSLETLAAELTEELNSMNIEHIDEADGDNFIKSWIISMKAVAQQKKVNKIKINSTDLEFAAKSAEGDKKKAMQTKSDQIKVQAVDLQRMVDDKFKGKGAIVDRRLASTKIKGQLDMIKRQSGMEDDPSNKADLKSKMKELADKYQEEVEAIETLKDENKGAIEAEKEKQRLRDEAEARRKGEDETTTKPAEGGNDETTTKPAEGGNDETTTKPAEGGNETTTKPAEGGNDETTTKPADGGGETTTKPAEGGNETTTKPADGGGETTTKPADGGGETTTKPAEGGNETTTKPADGGGETTTKPADGGGETTTKKETTTNEALSLSMRAEAVGLHSLANEIKTKQDWQVMQGTTLREKFESAIKTEEYRKILNESKYSVNSIKDAFNKLM
jgi:hypothetical protein